MSTPYPLQIGIGGWTFPPWRGPFYPAKLPHARELAYAAQRLTGIEVNGTFYRTQTPATFAKWAAEVPDGFKFSLKAPAYAVNRRVLAEAGESIARFAQSGLEALGDRLGPVLWQFAGTKQFDADDMAAFIRLLPAKAGDRPLRHALEPRHPSFATPAFTKLAADAGAAIVFADSDDYPCIDASEYGATADFTYARLQRSREAVETGYDAAALDGWAARAKGWAARGEAYVFFISGAKVRNPAAAMALIERTRTVAD